METETGLYVVPDLDCEIEYATSRSSGKGGQHVNTTESRVELKFNIPASAILSEAQKDMLLSRLNTRLSNSGTLRMYSQKERSQAANKEDVRKRFYDLIAKALKPVTKRIRVKPGKAVKEARLQAKKALAVKKELRKPPDMD